MALAVLICAAPSARADTAPTASVDEIIVTARRLEERVQDVPMSMQVLSGQSIDDTGLDQISSLQFNIPGLVVNSLGANGASFSLRGVGDQGGGALAVATHLDGVYLGDANLAIARLFDVERIEIMKGPQGTLYGRNSTGGSINILTRMPAREFSAAVEATYGSFSTSRLHGHANLPTDWIDFRFAFALANGDGFIRNTVDDRKFAEDDFVAFRAAARLRAGDRTALQFTAQRVVDDGASNELWLPNPAYLPDPEDIRLTTVTLADPFLDSTVDNVSLLFEHDFAKAQLRSISAYAESTVRDNDDCAGLPELAGCVRRFDPKRFRQWSQEFQLVSAGRDEHLWMLGANFARSRSETNYYLLTPAVSARPRNDLFNSSDDDTYALFGQANFALTNKVKATAGLRHSREHSTVSESGAGFADNPTPGTRNGDWSNTSWRLDLLYEPASDLTFYGSVSTGFKSGGFTAYRQPNSDFAEFRPENLLAWEAGVKMHLSKPGPVIDVAIFHYDFSDLQVTTYVIEDGDFELTTDNAAQAQIFGIDSSASVSPTRRLKVTAGIVWLAKREFVDYQDARNGDTLSGNLISRAPEWTTTLALDYQHPPGKFGSVSAQLEYNYRSDFYYTKENLAIFHQGAMGLLNVRARFDSASSRWSVFAAGRNLTDEDYLTQVFLQSSPGYPATWEVGFGLYF